MAEHEEFAKATPFELGAVATAVTNSANPPPRHPALTEADAAYLDTTPYGECRSLTVSGRTFTVDRRWFTQIASPQFVDPVAPSLGEITFTEPVLRLEVGTLGDCVPNIPFG